MAVDPNRQTFMQQLGEMRNIRTAQLRTNSTVERQNQSVTRLNTTMGSVLQANKQTNQILRDSASTQKQLVRQNDSMIRSLGNLSSTFARSISGLSSSLGRGAVGAAGAAGNAAMGVGRVSASAVAGVSSAIVSSLATVLPVAIAGYLGKTMVWDNIEPGTKKELQENFSGVMKNIFGGFKDTEFGKSVEPMIDRMEALFSALGDTLDDLGNKMGSISGKVGKKVEQVKATADVKGEALSRTVAPMINAGKVVKESMSGLDIGGVSLSDIAGTAMAAGAAKLGYETYKEGFGSSKAVKPSPLKPGAAAPKLSDAAKSARDFIGKNKLPGNVLDMLAGRMDFRILKAGGTFASKYMAEFKKVKLGNTFFVLGILMELGMAKFVHEEINIMVQERDPPDFTQEEAQALHDWVDAQKWGSIIGGATLGTLGAIGGGVVGSIAGPLAPYIALGAGALSSYYGAQAGQALAGKLVTLPESITKPREGIAPTSPGEAVNQRLGGASEKPQGSLTPSSGTVSSGNKNIDFVTNRRKREGSRQNPYQSAEGGTPTVGIGHKLSEEEKKAGGVFIDGKLVPLDLGNVKGPGSSEKGKKQLTEEQVEKLYAQDQQKMMGYVRAGIGKEAFDKLSPDQQWALTDLAFAMGPGFAKDPKLKKMIESGDTKGVAEFIRSRGRYYTKDKKKIKSAQHEMAAEGRADLYAGGGSLTGGGGGQTMLAEGGKPAAGEDGGASPTAGMTFSERLAYYSKKKKEGKEGGEQVATGEAAAKPEEKKSMLAGFGSMISTSYADMKDMLLKGVEENMQREADSSAGTVINYNGGETNVNSNSGGGGGGSVPAYNPIAPSPGYQTQFTSIAGVQRA